MPIYEYRCSKCGHEIEALQKIAEPPLVVCPSCHAESLVKLVSASAFQLKGSGWYATDFKGGAKPAAKPGEDVKPAAGTASDSKSEAKPESKPESTSDAKTEAKPEVKAATKTESAAPSGGTGGSAS